MLWLVRCVFSKEDEEHDQSHVYVCIAKYGFPALYVYTCNYGQHYVTTDDISSTGVNENKHHLLFVQNFSSLFTWFAVLWPALQGLTVISLICLCTRLEENLFSSKISWVLCMVSELRFFQKMKRCHFPNLLTCRIPKFVTS